MLKTIFTDRRVWLLMLLLAVVAVVCRQLLPPDLGFKFVGAGGYWLTFALVVMFLRACVSVVREMWPGAKFGRFDVCVLAGVAGITAVWCAHDRQGYKVLADEVLLSGTAMGMHYERLATYPIRATDVQGSFEILTRALDKRPLLFPWLVCTVHDLTGYRPENAFYLNKILAAVFLGLVYLTAWKIGGTRWAGVLGILLFAGLPLMAQQATGSGFELLNLLMIVAVVLLAAIYLEKPDARRLEALVWGGLMLAFTRYESALFLVPVAVVAALGWWRKKEVVLNWPLLCSPLFLVIPLLQNRIFSEQAGAWQTQGLAGATEPFGLHYLAPNLGHALAFFFEFSGRQPNSPLFAGLGLLCLPFFGLWMVRVLRQGTQAPAAHTAWAVMGCGLFLVNVLYMVYFWGQFDDPIIRRLSLPAHLLMMVAICVVGTMLWKREQGWRVVSGVVLAGVLVHSMPVMARQAYRTLYSPGMEMEIRKEFLDACEDRNLLFIDNDSIFWILNKISSSPVEAAKIKREGVAYHLRNHSFKAIYVFQSILVDGETGSMRVDPADDLGPGFELVPVVEKKVQTLLFARISRLKSITLDGKTTVVERQAVEPLRESRTVDELEKARTRYLEHWVKQLP
jgi:Dolichyl-phosphate-mannose-protein mannosyltransferase